MADDNDNDDQGEHNAPETGATFTQADIDRIAAKEKKQGRQAALKEIADDLGVTPTEAKAIIAASRKAEADAMSETEKARAEAAEAKAEAEAMKAEAAADRLAAKVERKLAAAGATNNRAARMLDITADADDDAIDEQIEALKADLPALFTTSDTTPAAAPSGVSVGTRGKPAPAGKTPLGKGADAFAQRKASKPTFTGASA